MMFRKVCIIGCGLIGSSIARAIKKNKLSNRVVSSNRSKDTNKKVIALNIVDEASSNTQKMVKESDLIIIATPLSSYKDVIKKINKSLKNGAIVTDVGSVKVPILNTWNKLHPRFVASHPMTGTEESGVNAGQHDLFKNKPPSEKLSGVIFRTPIILG